MGSTCGTDCLGNRSTEPIASGNDGRRGWGRLPLPAACVGRDAGRVVVRKRVFRASPRAATRVDPAGGPKLDPAVATVAATDTTAVTAAAVAVAEAAPLADLLQLEPFAPAWWLVVVSLAAASTLRTGPLKAAHQRSRHRGRAGMGVAR